MKSEYIFYIAYFFVYFKKYIEIVKLLSKNPIKKSECLNLIRNVLIFLNYLKISEISTLLSEIFRIRLI